jgi:hypothetical protein
VRRNEAEADKRIFSACGWPTTTESGPSGTSETFRRPLHLPHCSSIIPSLVTNVRPTSTRRAWHSSPTVARGSA